MLNNKVTSPAMAMDRLSLPQTFPPVPDTMVSRFPELADYNAATQSLWKKTVSGLQDMTEITAQTVNSGAGASVNNLRVTLDGLTAELADLAQAFVTAEAATARRLISVSAIASSSSGITVSAVAPSLPALNDIWVDITTPATPVTRKWNGVAWVEVTQQISAAAVAAEQTARVTADGFLSGKYTLTVVAGDVVTGMNITSSSGPGSTISEVTFRADRFKIYNGSAGRIMFDVTGSQVRLGGTLVVDTPSNSVYIGTGTYGNSNTAWYVDDDGFFSLGNQLTWNPNTATLTILGSISAVTGTVGGFNVGADYIRDVGNNFGLASTVTGGDDVRFWAGSSFATRGTAPFRVLEGGAMVASSGLISNIQITTNALQSSNYIAGVSGWYVGQNGLAEFNAVTVRGASTIAGWDVGSTTISKNNATLDSAGQLILGTSNDIIYVSATDATYRLWIGNVTAGSATFRVTKGGVMTATGAVVTGTITASAGTIGGWTLSSTQLSGTNAILDSGGTLSLGTSNDIAVISANDATYRIWIGNATAGSATFRVTKGGLMTATNAVITGMITSSTISGGTISIGSGIQNFGVSGGQVTFGDTSSGPYIALYSPGANEVSFGARNLAGSVISGGTVNIGGGGNVAQLFAVTSTGTATVSANATGGGTASISTSDGVTGTSITSAGELRVNGNKVVGARGTRGAAGITEVVALLDAWGSWA